MELALSPDLALQSAGPEAAVLLDDYSPPRRANRRDLATMEESAAIALLGERYAHRQSGYFPTGRGWRISADNAWHWFVHRFERLLTSPQVVERLNVAEDELLLLVYDLDLYQALAESWLAGRGPEPADLVTYLTPGREHWGLLGLAAELLDAPE